MAHVSGWRPQRLTMWLWILASLAVVGSLATGFLLGMRVTGQSLEAAKALQESAAQLMDLRRLERTSLLLLRLLRREEKAKKEWTGKIDRMDVTMANVIKALHRMGGIVVAPGATAHGQLSLGSRPGVEAGPTQSKSGSDRLDGHI